ncbi:hypothetical protein COEREDRAFT_7582 [Coemansia reversa NRRL 1564]|uniref:Thioesterase domain-containing protein n=1 Tax=Coemansia reversa (strain ATCC 12441 / NRRL 1564) TaxID=763665 RepID=A0A2G5BE04_COERN|nr:hypothetical protein COEREDRAFT_7582 [Coemansia reversa NRRL 1564]|eukprot:PIA17222.1 hypothetical protein COEREDRAFT_7582 [Coemansia reversa NRRL 1564]
MYGSEDGTVVIETDTEYERIVLGLRVEVEHINAAGTLDEGLVATLADMHTTFLLMSHSLLHRPDHNPMSVTVCLSVHAVAPIEPGTEIHIVCTVAANSGSGGPQASVVFQSAHNSRIIFATATHSKQTRVLEFGGKL